MLKFHFEQSQLSLRSLKKLQDLFEKRISGLPAGPEKDKFIVELEVGRKYLADLEYHLKEIEKSNGGRSS